ncbi:MFS transporter [Alicyclobacillus sp. ALC3]|uniref:MFS transporter n=1 Tax=Alicyclobacillus sp. ALC3 TaxID=2796143 RepID=UPI00237A059C|nr:MFS transporter [Alicyclobacillus sp. ALC3]
MSRTPMHPIARRLIWIRGLRSIGQGAMVVDITLYLRALHWSGASIGGVTTVAGLVGAALILAVGVLSDRIGRKPFLLIYEALTIMAAVAACFTSHAMILILAIVIAGFGRGQSGAAGPFSPAEQAWLARVVGRSERGRVFSLNNAVGFIGMAFGSLLGGMPDLVHGPTPLTDYRPVFVVVAVLSVACATVIAFMQEERTAPIEQPQRTNLNPKVSDDDSQILRRENRSMMKLAAVNAINGLAIGLTGPMMAYWFSLRYGVSTSAIGITLSIGFLATGLFSIVNGMMATRIGMVKSVTWMRVIGSLMMLTLPWMPNFALASALYIMRNAVNRGTQGNRTALSASLTRDNRRGFATSVNALSMRLPSAVGPTVSGYLFDMNELALPLILTAMLQLANAGLYQWVFGQYDKQERTA